MSLTPTRLEKTGADKWMWGISIEGCGKPPAWLMKALHGVKNVQAKALPCPQCEQLLAPAEQREMLFPQVARVQQMQRQSFRDRQKSLQARRIVNWRTFIRMIKSSLSQCNLLNWKRRGCKETMISMHQTVGTKFHQRSQLW